MHDVIYFSFLKVILAYFNIVFQIKRGSRDPIVVGFIINYAIHVYNQQFESRTDEMYSIQYFMIKFVSILWQVDVFFQVFRFPLRIKLTATI
jgi:hypothetical protein